MCTRHLVIEVLDELHILRDEENQGDDRREQAKQVLVVNAHTSESDAHSLKTTDESTVEAQTMPCKKALR